MAETTATPSTATFPYRVTVIPAVIGFLGSLMVLVGSFSVGWLAAASPLNRSELLVPLRTTDTGVIWGTVLLTVGVWFMFWGWLRLGVVLRRRTAPSDGFYRFPRGALASVNGITALWSAPLLFCLPIFSRDVFAYLNQGRLMLSGGDPYQEGISNLSNWFQLGTDTTWAQDATPYGPVFLHIEAAVMAVSGNSPDLAIFLFRLAAVAGVVLQMWFVPKLAVYYGTDPARAQWIASANPLFLISFIASAHNDSLMIGLALAAVWFAIHRRGVIAVLLMVGSIGIKPITLVLLPFIGLFWAGTNASWLKRCVYWAYTLGLTVVAMALIGLANGTGFGWVEVMAGTGTGSVPWAPIGIAAGMISNVLGAFAIPTYWVLDTLKLIGRLISVLIVLALMFFGERHRIFSRMTWAFTALVLLSPIIQPWYLLWIIPLFVILGVRGNWELKIIVVIVAYFIGFGAMDQLSIWQFVTVRDQMPGLSSIISVIAAVWILLLDPWTSRIMKSDWHIRSSLPDALRTRLPAPKARPSETPRDEGSS